MRLTAFSAIWLSFWAGPGVVLMAQQSYPPINRNIEMHEKSIKSMREREQKELQQRLGKAREAAARLVALADELEGVGPSGDLPVAPEVQKTVKKVCKDWRKQVGSVEDIGYLDPSSKDEPAEYAKANSPAEYSQLKSDMKTLAAAIRLRVDELVSFGVNAQSLQTMSLDAMTESAKRLSKAVETSGEPR